MKQKRLASVSLVRLFAFALIFTFHCFFFDTTIVSQRFFPFSAAVQTFLFLSGFLYSQKQVERKGFFKEEFIKLAWPCLLYFIGLLFFDGLYLSFNGGDFSFPALKFAYGSMKCNGYAIQFGNLWYIPVLLVCYAFLPLLSDARKRGLFLVLAVFIIGVELIFCYVRNEPIVAIPFVFGYGYGSRHFADDVDPKRKKDWTFYLLPILLLVGLVFLYDSLVDQWAFNTMLQGPIGVLFGIVGLRCFRFLNAKEEPFALTYLGKLTLGLYLVHETFLCGWTDLTASGPLALGIPLALLASVLAAVALTEGEKHLKNYGKPRPNFLFLLHR